MKLKLTLDRAGRPAVDLAVTVDATATVGDVADAFLRKDPTGADPAWRDFSAPPTLALVAPSAVELDAATSALDSGLRSGCTVRLTRATTDHDAATAAAIVQVVEGPDQGRDFPLHLGTNIIGRTGDCEVRLTDTFVSREHAKINVATSAELVDLGSANGVFVDDELQARTVLRPGNKVRLGDTVFVVEVSAGVGRSTGATNFNRSPRLDPTYAGMTFSVPEPPQPQQGQRFPFLPLLAPLLFGAVLYAVTRSPTSLIFVALSPVMMLANVVESRTANRRAYRRALEQFREDLRSVVEEAQAKTVEERTRRLAEHPATAECVDGLRSLSPLVWCRRPSRDRFLEVRIGTGTLPSRHSIELPPARQCPRPIWQEIREATAEFSTISGVPVSVALPDLGVLGVAGPRPDSLAVARSLVLQLVTLHSPSEVVLAALASTQTALDWDWLPWLPHVSSPHSPVDVRHLATSAAAGSSLLTDLRRLIDERSAVHSSSLAGPAIVVLIEDDAPVTRSLLVDLGSRGPAVGVYVVWVAEAVAELPAICLSYVDVQTGGASGLAGFLREGTSVAPVSFEPVSAEEAANAARRLAPLVDSGAVVDDDSDLPRSVSWLAVHDPDLATTPSTVIEQWSASGSLMTGPYAPKPGERRPKGSLRAVIGQNAGEPHALDLRAQGPHALVGGTTGSGKSELLQSWILSLAAAHSPQRVNFLLVDYKGGSAFKDCLALPHTVGLVTDLSPHLVRRALTSLRAELRTRERLLATHRAKDLLELEAKGSTETPPSLVIVVDEFAALVQEVPEFVDGVVDVAQRGRSLGLHLILATQRPAGVIKDNLRANTNLRLALRVADEGDSTDVLGSPEAAAFDPATPGRAVSKTGPGRLAPFQAAYAGGWTSGEIPPPIVDVEELAFGAGRTWVLPQGGETDPGEPQGATDIQRVVRTIAAASTSAELPPPRRPWLPELAEIYDLAKLPTRRRDDELVFGVRDDPEAQQQPTVAFVPDRDGNLVVYGTGGSGKSTLLRTLAIAAGFTIRGGPCEVYGLDFGSRGLAMLEDLPHVGSIIQGSDDERVTRLLRVIRAEVDDRAARYSAEHASTITEYRRLAKAPDEPRILILVDGIAAFRQAYEGSDRFRWLDTFTSIAGEGRPVGVHVVLAAEQRSALWPSLASSVQRRLVLRMASDDDYSLLNVPTDVLDESSPAGRALLDADEVQVAVLGGSQNVLTQAAAVSAFAAATVKAGTHEVAPVESLASDIPLEDLPTEVDGCPVLGVADESLAPQAFQPKGSFLVTGPPGSGRSSALHLLAASLRRWQPTMPLHYIGNERSELAMAEFWTGRGSDPDSIRDLVDRLTAKLRTTRATAPQMALFLEGVVELSSGPHEQLLQGLVKLALERDHLVVFEAESSLLTSSMGLLGYAKSGRRGVALQPEQQDGTTAFRTQFPRIRRADFPPGRGLLVGLGRTTVVQMARA